MCISAPLLKCVRHVKAKLCIDHLYGVPPLAFFLHSGFYILETEWKGHWVAWINESHHSLLSTLSFLIFPYISCWTSQSHSIDPEPSVRYVFPLWQQPLSGHPSRTSVLSSETLLCPPYFWTQHSPLSILWVSSDCEPHVLHGQLFQGCCHSLDLPLDTFLIRITLKL